MQDQTNDSFKLIEKLCKSYSLTFTYILFVLSCLLLICCFINFRSGHRYQSILANLRNWHSTQLFQQYDIDLKRRLTQMHTLISKLENLKEEQQKLLLRVQKNYIEENQQQDQIEQIKTFQHKIKQITHFLKKNKPKVEAFGNQYQNGFLQLKNEYKGKQSQGLVYFKRKGQHLVTLAEQIQDYLAEQFIKHERWYKSTLQSQINREDKELDVRTEVEFFDQTYQSRVEFKSMPSLARSVLNPNPLPFLTFLYQKQDNLKQFLVVREKFYDIRRQLSKSKSSSESLSLMQSNMLSWAKLNEWSHEMFQEYDRIEQKYRLSGIKEEKSICIVVPSFNNNQQYRVQLNLNSIFSQNYTNYKVLIIDDASTDKTQELLARYLKYYNITEDKAQLILNEQPKKALQNIYQGTLKYCQNQQIVVIVDGDDELIGLNVLKVVNAAYSKQKIGFMYSNFYYYQQSKAKVQEGFTMEYTDAQKQQNYRRSNQKFSHLITFKTQLLRQVKEEDLKDEYGKFYDVAYDYALSYPIMQLACSHVKKLDQYQYLYKIGTGLNDFEIKKQHQITVAKKILAQKPYQCALQYYK